MNDDNNQDRIREATDTSLMGECVRLANHYKKGKRLTGGASLCPTDGGSL